MKVENVKTIIVAVAKFNENEKEKAISDIKAYTEHHGLAKPKFTQTGSEIDIETGATVEAAAVEFKATVEIDSVEKYEAFKSTFDQTSASQRIRYDDAQKMTALALLKAGHTYDAVASEIGCSKNTVIKWKRDAANVGVEAA